jgi:hypothetical protein
MENIRRLAKKCADDLHPRASSAGTAELFQACLEMVVEMAIALNCNNARTTGTPGYGILFEVTGQENAGQFSFFATRPNFGHGVVALAISDDAVGERAAELHARVHDICRNQGVAIAANGRNKWPAIGFTTVAAGTQIIRAVAAFLLNQTPPDHPTAESTADPTVLRYIIERRGQPAFRKRLLAAYGGRCVITGCSVVEALEAAHIVPHSADGAYASSNGFLMRADIHTLFDLHLLSVCPDTNVVQLNPRLRPAYGHFEGQVLFKPIEEADKPDTLGLARHYAIWQTLL